MLIQKVKVKSERPLKTLSGNFIVSFTPELNYTAWFGFPNRSLADLMV